MKGNRNRSDIEPRVLIVLIAQERQSITLGLSPNTNMHVSYLAWDLVGAKEEPYEENLSILHRCTCVGLGLDTLLWLKNLINRMVLNNI